MILKLIIAFLLIMIFLRSSLLITFNRYSHKVSNSKYNGKDIARRILNDNKLSHVATGYTPGHLTDHYDSNTKSLYLSEYVHDSYSLPAIAVAAHEASHAIQDRDGGIVFSMNIFLSKIVSMTSKFTRFFIYIGFIFGITPLLTIGLVLLGITFFYQILSIPVEIDASFKAYQIIKEYSLLENSKLKYIRRVLFSAFLTYIYIVIYTPINTLRPFPK